MSMPATTWWGDSVIENRTYEEIAVGDQASLTRLLTVEDIQLQLEKEKAAAEKLHRKEKDDENKSYFSGQLDLIERLEAFISV